MIAQSTARHAADRHALRHQPTRRLLRWLASARRCGGVYSPCWNNGAPQGRLLTDREIRAELATREHVPNKPEARELRRAEFRAKRRRDRGRR